MRAILTYHSIDPSGSPISVDEPAFRRHVEWLASGTVQVVGLEHILDVPADRDAIAVTFDDALASLADVAWPLLCEHGLPATVFVPTGRVGRDNSWGDAPEEGVPTFALCDWESLARMHAEGLSVGSHSVSHARLDGLDDEALRAELEDSAAEIERRLGTRPPAFAYPFGECDERVARLAAELYRVTVTTDLRVLGDGDQAHGLPRLDAFYYRAKGRLEDWGSAAFRRHLWLRGTARRLRRSLAPQPGNGSRNRQKGTPGIGPAADSAEQGDGRFPAV